MNVVAARPALRIPYPAIGLLLLAAVVYESIEQGFTWQLPAFALGPDLALVLGAGWFVGGLAWAMHIAFDRTLGYGLRTKDGFQCG